MPSMYPTSVLLGWTLGAKEQIWILSWSSDTSQLRCHLLWAEQVGCPVCFFLAMAFIPLKASVSSLTPSQCTASPRGQGLGPVHCLVHCCMAGTPRSPVPGSESLLNGWMVDDPCQAWSLRSLFRKFSNPRFPSKQSPRQSLTFKKFIRGRPSERACRTGGERQGTSEGRCRDAPWCWPPMWMNELHALGPSGELRTNTSQLLPTG